MPNDRETSELLSKSFYGRLTAEEQFSLDEELEGNGESAAYAKLSRMIQDSVVEVVRATEEGDEDIAPGLSEARTCKTEPKRICDRLPSAYVRFSINLGSFFILHD